MRMRIISVAVVLGLGIVGSTLARQIGEQPKAQASERAKLRAQVVKLRVDIELLEFEHDAARAEILEITKSIRALESEGVQEQMKQLAFSQLTLTADSETLKNMSGKENEKKMEDAFKSTFKDEVVNTKVSRDRNRNDYAKQAAELAEKRLELAEIEKRYSENR
jgi:homoserine dehydrogenase